MDIIQFREDYNAQNDEDLKNQLFDLFSFEGYKPQVKIDGNIIHIHIDSAILESTSKKYEKASELCNRGKYQEAIPLFEEVVKICPLHVDAYRSMAQAYMMLGDLEKALDTNLDTLRIDGANIWGLILMGNIFNKKNDSKTAMTYYEKVLTYHPENALALNNIGAALMEQKKFDNAIDFFEKAKSIDSTYMNTYYGLALAHYKLGDVQKAWEVAREGALISLDRKENPHTREELMKLYVTSAMNAVERLNPTRTIADIIKDIQEKYNTVVKIEEDNSLKVYAKLMYGPTYGRDYHLIKYNSQKKYTDHLVMHEFMHLYMALAARKLDKNLLVASNQETELIFIRKFKKFIDTLTVRLGREKVMEYVKHLHQGFVLQLMNGPLDLLVEDRIFRNYPEVRPLQMLSLFQQEQDNIASIQQGMKNPGIVPNQIFNASKILNIITSLHLKELYGMDFISYYKPTKSELDKAKDMYEEYKAYRDDYQPGEEYDMMNYFIEQLDCEDLLTTINEKDFVDRTVRKRESTPTGVDETFEKNDDFAAQHKDGKNATETFMMSMYMVGAMEYFDNMPKDQIRTIAFEIAMLGCGGINPANKSGYKVNSIPGKDFGGYELLAYYYVSWAIAVPEKLDALQLPFKSAYDTALQLFNSKKGQ